MKHEPYENIYIEDETGYVRGRIADGHATITSLAVQTYRKGHGTRFFKEFESKAVAANVDSISIEVFEDNERAMKFWESHGFVNDGHCCFEYIGFHKDLVTAKTSLQQA